MLRVYNAKTANEVWTKLGKAFIEGDCNLNQGSRCGATHEILHVAFSIDNPRQRWIVSREPALNPAFAIAEVIWILRGRNDSGFLNYFNRQLPKFAGDVENYHGAYGHRLRKHFGVDQLERAYDSLRQNPQSRQVVLEIWDSKIDLPNVEGKERAPDIPCNLVSMLKVRNGRLEWTQVMRSNDFHLGLPHNIVQFTTIQEVMAGWLGLQIGSYNHISDSLHVYDSSFQNITAPTIADALPNSDELYFTKEISDESFKSLEQGCGRISQTEVSANALQLMVVESSLPIPFRNMLCVLCAEGARKRGHLEVGNEIMLKCTNPIFIQLWQRWIRRVSSGAIKDNSVSKPEILDCV